MAVISELIDAGLSLKEQGNHQAAIEHFRQLYQTYPDHARIMFELAGAWQLFGVPEQALPLYRRLMAMPKSQGLPPKEMPRLYTQMGACLRLMGQFSESLEIIEEGLALYPDYRPLRAYRMFALHSSGYHQNAMLDALELMLESLAPTKWDLYENEIVGIVSSIRERIPEPNTDDLEEWVFDEYWTDESKKSTSNSDDVSVNDGAVSVDAIIDEATAITNGEEPERVEIVEIEEPDADKPTDGKIQIEDDNDADDGEFEVEVKVIKSKKPQPKSKKPKFSIIDYDEVFGDTPEKIDITEGDDEENDPPKATKEDKSSKTSSDDEPKAPPSGKINIPIDLD